MIIQELQLKAFGKFHNKTVSLQPGANVIEGQNEAGKSTIHAFIGAMLFGLDKVNDEKEYRKYKPWMEIGGYQGALTIENAGDIYYLERDFIDGTLALTRIGSGDTLTGTEAQEKLKSVMGGLTKQGYRNTVCIGQMKGTTDDTIAEELNANLDNLCKAKSLSVDFKKAEDTMNRWRTEVESRIYTDIDAEINKLENQIKDKSEELKNSIKKAEETKVVFDAASREYEETFVKFEKHRQDIRLIRESIEKEQSEIDKQKQLWEETSSKAKAEIEAKKDKVEKLRAAGKDVTKAFAPINIPFIILAILFAAGAAAAFWFYYQPEGELPLYILGYSCIAAVAVCFIACLARHKLFVGKKGYYRTLIERYSRMSEYERRRGELASAKDTLFMEMAKNSDVECFSVAEKKSAAEKAWNEAMTDRNDVKTILDEAMEQYKKAAEKQKKNESNVFELAAMQIAWDNIIKASEKTGRTFGKKLIQRAGEMLAIITDEKYNSLHQENGTIILTGENDTAEVSRVSRGTMEQVYLCIRLAATELLAPNANMPLLLDDTFAYYDDERTKKAIKLLKNCGHQVIIMTCQSREKKLLKEV